MERSTKQGDATGAVGLDLPGAARSELALAAIALLERLDAQRRQSPIFTATPGERIDQMRLPPPEEAADSAAVLAKLEAAAACGWSKAHPGDLAYIPSGGVFSGTIAALLASGIHAYTGAAAESPALIALEESVLSWFAGILGLPEESEGVLLSGGSVANQAAIVCARSRAFDPERSRVYLSDRTHHSLHKALRLSGVPDHCVCSTPTRGFGGCDVEALHRQIAEDVRVGRSPWLVVATAGSTDTGAVDNLGALATLRDTYGFWLHVDAAYGGMFALTERGAAIMRGIERADSVTVDAHKGLSLPYGVGALLVRHAGILAAAHSGRGAYMQDVPRVPGLPHYFERGPELTRPFRGLLIWLPLQLHGVHAFRDFLNRSLDLARAAARQLRSLPGISVPADPDLSIVVFRASSGDDATAAMLAALNATGRLHVSSTTLEGRTHIRLAFLSPATSEIEIAAVIESVEATLQRAAVL